MEAALLSSRHSGFTVHGVNAGFQFLKGVSCHKDVFRGNTRRVIPRFDKKLGKSAESA